MGYERGTTFVLTFEDPSFEGLEVRARGISTGHLFRILDLVEMLEEKNLSPAQIKQLDTLFRVFAGCPAGCTAAHEDQGGNHYARKLKSWNLTEDGEPVPATYEGLMSQDFEFTQTLVEAWLDGMVGTPGPLDESSTDGGQFQEESIPMEILSVALPN